MINSGSVHFSSFRILPDTNPAPISALYQITRPRKNWEEFLNVMADYKNKFNNFLQLFCQNSRIFSDSFPNRTALMMVPRAHT
jgi:hypothetical protein